MRYSIAAFIMIVGIASPLLAGNAPEIDSYSATAAIGLIGGAVLLIRGRSRK